MTFNTKNKFPKNVGFSLVEVMVALGVMGFISAGTMQLIKMQTKSQKSINISMEKSNLLFRIKSNLMTEGGCLGTINSARNNYAVGDTSAENCMLNGTSLPSINKINDSGIFISQIARRGQIVGVLGTQVEINDIRFISSQTLDATNQGELIDATFCIKLIAQGSDDISYGSLETIHAMPVNITSVPPGGSKSDDNIKSIDSCNSDQTDYIAVNCQSLGGTIGDDFTCNGVNIKPKETTSTTNFNLVENSAINAMGNAGIEENLVVCGNVSIGDSNFNIKERLGINTNCSPEVPGITSGVLTVGKMLDVGELITTENATFDSRVEIGKDGGGTLIVDGQTELISGNLSVTNGKVFTNDLTVKNKAYFKGDIQADKIILEDEVTVGDVTIHKNYINSPKELNIETNEVTVYGKIKAIQNGASATKVYGDEIYASPNPDYLATETWVRSIVLSQMSDESKKKLIDAMLLSANDTGIDSLRSNFLEYGIQFYPNPYSDTRVEFTSNSLACENESSSIYKIEREWSPVTKTLFIKVWCRTPSMPTGTPTNCEWVEKTHYSTNFATVNCPDGKTAMNISCRKYDMIETDQVTHGSTGEIMHEASLKSFSTAYFKTNPPCNGNDCITSSGLFYYQKIARCLTNETCNGGYCNYTRDTYSMAKALCCNM